MNLFESPWDDEDTSRVAEVLNRGTYWSSGPEVEDFESEIAALSRRSHGIAFNSGTTALYAMLESLDVRGTDVIVPSFTFPATVNAVVMAGGTPVFADIETTTMGLDSEHVESLVGPRTSAIVVVHFAGFIAEQIDLIRSIASKHRLALVEDNAHSLAATREGNPSGSFGIGSMTSHCFNKLITTGEGGCLALDDESLVRRLRRIRSHGRDPRQDRDYDEVGSNFRLSTLSATVGLAQLDRLDALVAERVRLANVYQEALAHVESLQTPRVPDDQAPIWLLYNVLLPGRERRDALADQLRERGIPSRVTYPPVHLYSYYREHHGGAVGQLPSTEAISEQSLTIPLYPGLSNADQELVLAGIMDFVRGRSAVAS